MGTVTIQSYTYPNPITMIGEESGVCCGADISSAEKNYRRGIDCLESEHGRTLEFPDVYMVISGYSARVMREWYTHIGGSPTRLQASTRYIDYEHGFDYYVPETVRDHEKARPVYEHMMRAIRNDLQFLDELGIPREDSANGLPLGMTTVVVCKHNLRNLVDMSHQRMCQRAYHEFQDLFHDVCQALRDYSPEWAYLVDHYFMPKCQYRGFCTERKSCGAMPKKEDVQ